MGTLWIDTDRNNPFGYDGIRGALTLNFVDMAAENARQYEWLRNAIGEKPSIVPFRKTFDDCVSEGLPGWLGRI